jgi:RNA polymerase sigma-70 factor (ECF subfamily)
VKIAPVLFFKSRDLQPNLSTTARTSYIGDHWIMEKREMNNVVPLLAKSSESDADTISLDDRDDDALMLMTRAGVARAFELLVRRHQRMVLGTAAKYLGDPLLAEDIAQNSFVDLFRYVAGYRPEGKLRALLAKIVINHCRMVIRRARTEANTRQGYQSLQEADARDDDAVSRREQQLLLNGALQALSPKLREVVILRYAADLSYKEISETLGIRVGTVRSRLFSGVERLSRVLEELER